MDYRFISGYQLETGYLKLITHSWRIQVSEYDTDCLKRTISMCMNLRLII